VKSLALGAGAAAAVLLTAAPALALADRPPEKAAETTASKTPDPTAGLARQDGLLPTYVDKDKGRILVALPKADADGVSGRFLYVTALKTGLGSAPVGLDRARPGRGQILVLRPIGGNVIAE
jgi:hypothetical protein